MTDTVSAAPSDLDIDATWDALPGIRIHNDANARGLDTQTMLRRAFARAVLATWGAPAQAAPSVGTIGHIGDGPTTLTAVVAPLLAAQAAPAAVAGPSEFPHEQMDAVALARYKVVPSHESMFHRHAVVAGDGSRQLYIGREVECQNMAHKFAGAFLDGAFAFHSMLAAAPTTQPAPAYKDSTPEMHVGDSAFENWYSTYNPAHKSDKQRAHDAYAAGMGDPLVMAAPAAVAVPTFEDFCKRHGLDSKKMDSHGGMWARVALDECRAITTQQASQQVQEVSRG